MQQIEWEFPSNRVINFIINRACMPDTYSESETLEKFWQQKGKNIPVSIIEWESKLRKIKEKIYLVAKPGCQNTCPHNAKNILLSLPTGERFGIAQILQHKPDKAMVVIGSREYFAIADALWGIVYADTDGALFSIHQSTPKQIAKSPEKYIEYLALKELCSQSVVCLLCEGNIAQTLANKLDIAFDEAVSNEYVHYFISDSFVIKNHSPAVTQIQILNIQDSDRLIAAMRALGARMMIEQNNHMDINWCEPTGKSILPPKEYARLWSPFGVDGWIGIETTDDGKKLLVQEQGLLSVDRRITVGSKKRETRYSLITANTQLGLSQDAINYLLACKAYLDPLFISQRNKLATLLMQWSLPDYPLLHAVNQQWSGLGWNGPQGTLLGTYAILCSYFPEPFSKVEEHLEGIDFVVDINGQQSVIIGSTAESLMYLHPNGEIWEYSTLSCTLFPRASSLAVRIESEAVLARITKLGHMLQISFAGSLAEKVADYFHVKKIIEASDHIVSWWVADNLSINECYSMDDGERVTNIFSNHEELLTQAKIIV